jgi:hypothetical protein
MLFCLQCGTSLAPPVAAAPDSSPQSLAHEGATVPLKIAPTPIVAQRAEHVRPSFRGQGMEEMDDETFKKSFERQGTHPGAVVCRFCKGPIDLYGDFCEQCGAPVSEAAPSGAVLPAKPEPAAPPAPAVAAPPPPPPPTVMPPRSPQVAPTTSAPTRSVTGLQPRPTSATGLRPAAPIDPHRRAPTRITPAPPPAAPPSPPGDASDPGLMGRLKGIFKKP